MAVSDDHRLKHGLILAMLGALALIPLASLSNGPATAATPISITLDGALVVRLPAEHTGVDLSVGSIVAATEVEHGGVLYAAEACNL